MKAIKKPLKVVLYIKSLDCGGAQRVIISLAHYLVDRGYDICIITTESIDRDYSDFDSRIRRIAFGFTPVNHRLGKLTNFYRHCRALRLICGQEKPDVIVAMMPDSIIGSIVASIGLPVRVIGSERNNPHEITASFRRVLYRRLFYRLADGHVAQTFEAARWLKDYTASNKVHVIPNPVIWPIPSFHPRLAPDSIIRPELKVILAVGTKPKQKGFDLLIQAFSGLAGVCPDWHLVILGVDPESEASYGGGASLKRLAERSGLVDRITLPGRVGNVSDWYKRAELFVLSSRYEGMPNALLEAMASGCPSVAFDCDTGPRDVIKHGINGMLVAAQDVRGLMNTMLYLIENDDSRAKLGRSAMSVREAFSEHRIMAMWEEILQLSAGSSTSRYTF